MITEQVLAHLNYTHYNKTNKYLRKEMTTYAPTQYRLRLGHGKKIANTETVELSDMIWAEKLVRHIPLLGLVEQSTTPIQRH